MPQSEQEGNLLNGARVYDQTSGMPTPTAAAHVLGAKGRALAWIETAALAIGGTLLLTLCSKITVPFYPVPMTLQTFGVLLIGATFGLRLGVGTILLYLLEGGLGLPVFAGTPGVGFVHLLGPTGGYLVGFVLAAAVVGYFADRGWNRHIGKSALAMGLGSVVLFLPGLVWLARFTGPEKAVALGLLPFLWGDFLKIALAALCTPSAARAIRTIRR